jgi:carbon storage regulator
MLVLTRKQGECIRIGDDIVVTVVRTKGKAVRLGIQAPMTVPVLRGEVADAINCEERLLAREGVEAEKDTVIDDADEGPEAGAIGPREMSFVVDFGSAGAAPLAQLVRSRAR